MASPRAVHREHRLFWAVLWTLVAGQLLAFYMLCSHQVRKQEARLTAAEVQRMAVSDCLRYLSNSTIASCAGLPPVVYSDAPVPNNLATRANTSSAATVTIHYAWR